MAASSRRKVAPLIEQVLDEGPRFDFFQAVRLLQLWAARASARGPAPSAVHRAGEGVPVPARTQPVGFDFAPTQEVVRFHAVASQSFPTSAVHRIVTQVVADRVSGAQSAAAIVREALTADTATARRRVTVDMYVNFLGLTGPLGVLPPHYTTLIVGRLREKDTSLADFLDLFNHRVVSLFYRAWEKYRFPIALERLRRAPRADEPEDLFTFCLYCLVGLGVPGLRRRQEVNDEAILYYSGHFAHSPRSALVLETILGDYFGQAIVVQQFQGQWLQLARDDQSSLPCPRWPRGLNNQLGATAIAGERVWDVQSKFRIRVGPLGYGEFCRLMPSGDMLRPMCQLTRTYVGPELDFDVQPVLRAAEIPWLQLAADSPSPARLGWNTWVRSGEILRDADDVVFRLAEI